MYPVKPHIAEKAHVETMEGKKAKPVGKEKFIDVLRAALKRIAPSNMEETEE